MNRRAKLTQYQKEHNTPVPALLKPLREMSKEEKERFLYDTM
jgi:hypothetical protein